MTDSTVTQHPAATKAAESLRLQLALARRAFAPPPLQALELRIIKLTQRVEQLERLESERKK